MVKFADKYGANFGCLTLPFVKYEHEICHILQIIMKIDYNYGIKPW